MTPGRTDPAPGSTVNIDADPRNADWLRPWVREGHASYQAWEEDAAERGRTAAVEVAVALRWEEHGALRAGLLPTRQLPSAAGLYRIRLVGADRRGVYIGETVDLARRFAGYRRPGPSQRTNERVAAAIRAHLQADRVVTIDLALDGELLVGGSRRPLVLGDPHQRRLAEAAAIACVPTGLLLNEG